MRTHQEQKDFILEEMTDEWEPTTQIAKRTGLHYYKAVMLLNSLWMEKKIKKDEKPNQIFWKLKKKRKNII